MQYNATLCHATLVKPSWFLATAGCVNLLVNRSDPQPPSVRLSGGVDLRVLSYTVHDRYNAALLKVATPVTNRSPACLPDYQRPTHYSGKTCFIEALDQRQMQVQMATEGSCGVSSISSQKICTQPPRSCVVRLPVSLE
uniref:Uncharacterized protein LOC116938020 n=1 Tax=Petromyzon marinus TaxID=7757 RepID=A0AAJ7SLW0_PETMA|nr:uncharacterized protein LOC116938020 [Petromyzon marinus]